LLVRRVLRAADLGGATAVRRVALFCAELRENGLRGFAAAVATACDADGAAVVAV
jgi:hypothetical protein